MESLTLIGVILVIVGLVLIPFTCFTSLFISLIGVILIVMGEIQGPSYVPPYPPPQYPPPQYPPQPYMPQGYACPACGMPLTYVAQYNRWYCNNCRAYR